MSKFVNRRKELDFLKNEYNKIESSFIVIYGRRRIGKTSLISQFIKNKNAIYFLATEESEKQNINMLKTQIAIYFKNELLKKVNIDNWEELFRLIVENKDKNKKIIVIDEFQYLGKSNNAFPSIFQRIWDTILKDKNVMVIVCGSLVNMMKTQILNYNSPLYGRRTGQIKLKQINFKHYRDFFKKMDEKKLIEYYAVTGGVPKYIEAFKEYNDIYQAINNNILNKQSFLYEEPNFLLKNEVNEVGSYFSIIKTIADGKHKLSKIATSLELPQTNLSKYLQVLINLDILEREVPITENNPEKSKKGLYKIKDNYISFWFKFIYPNLGYIESGNEEFVLEKIKNNLIDNHISYVYEDICKEKIWDLNIERNMGVNKIGKWWNQNEEIDIVGINETNNSIIFGECKYLKKAIDIDVLAELERKSKLVDWRNCDRKETFILFSISGYSNRLKEISKKRNDLILM